MTDLTQIQREFYQKKVGTTSQMPMNQLEMTYWRSRTGRSTKFYDQLQKEWLIYEIGQAGGTPTAKTIPSLWTQLTGKRLLNEAKLHFYLNN